MEEIFRIIILILKALGYAIQAIMDFFLYYADDKFYRKHTFWYMLSLIVLVIIISYLIIHS